MSILVFGASGFLGRALRSHFERKGKTVIGTYHSKEASGLRHFDLERADVATLGPDLDNVRFAIICSSVTDMDRCNTDWASTHRVNVDGIVALITQLQSTGIVPLFVSTDYVYEGAKGNYSETEERRPVLAYGKQKKATEDFLLGSERPFIIVRTGKIYSLREQDATLLTSIPAALRAGESLRMATDQIFTPSHVQDLCEAIDRLMQARSFGCFNVGPDSSISRFELATLLKDQLGIKTGQVIPCSLSDLSFGDSRPLDTSLNSQHFVQTTGFRFEGINESVQRLRRMAQLSHSE